MYEAKGSMPYPSPPNSAQKRRRPGQLPAQLEVKADGDTWSPSSSPSTPSPTSSRVPSTPSSPFTTPSSPREAVLCLTRKNLFRLGFAVAALIGAKILSSAHVEQRGEKLTPAHGGHVDALIGIPTTAITGRSLRYSSATPVAVQLSVATSSNHIDDVSAVEPLRDVTHSISSLPSPPTATMRTTIDIPSNDECKPMAKWQVEHHPSCLMFHETDLQPSSNVADAQVLASGYYRTVWRIDDGTGKNLALKTLRFPSEKRKGEEIAKLHGYGVGFDETIIQQQRTDAIVMAQLQTSRHVARIYGYCSTSAMVEFGDGGNLRDLVRKENLTEKKKLELAINASEALTDVHNYNAKGYATIAHTDINPKQFLYIGGSLKLNDFNRGILLQWNAKKEEPCPIDSGIAWRARYQSPEEHLNVAQSEMVDIFTLGLVLWVILTRHTTPYRGMDHSERRDFVSSGKTLFNISSPAPELVSKHPYETAIASAIWKCWTFDPQERPTAGDILALLRNAKANHRKSWHN